MDLRTETKVIGGLTVSVQQFAARRAWKLTARLIRTLGPAIVPLVEGGDFGRADAGQLMQAMWTLSDEAADELLCAILAGTTVSGVKEYPGNHDLVDPVKIDLAFGGDLASCMEAALFALEVNFANFIARLLSLVAPLVAKAAAADPRATRKIRRAST